MASVRRPRRHASLTRQRPYLTARVAEPSEVVVVPADVFRARVMTDVRLSDTVLEAFLARRAVLLSAAADTLKIIGQAFDEAWLVIAGKFSTSTAIAEAGRLRLADALLASASKGSRDVEALKRDALEAMELC